MHVVGLEVAPVVGDRCEQERQERDRVRHALNALPDKEKDLIRWLYFEERDKDEICRELNVDRNYLRVLLHRAKARFKDQFVEEGPR